MNDWMPPTIRDKAVTPPAPPVADDPPKPDTTLAGFDNTTPALIRASYLLQKYGSGVNFLEEAAAVGAAAVEQLPEHPAAWDALGTALRALNETDEAIGVYQRGVDLAPLDLRLKANMAAALVDGGYIYDGIVRLQEVLAENPNFAYAFLAYTRAVLLTGDLERGWMLYAQRRNLTNFAAQINKYPVPQWDGHRKERVLLVGEEGAGEKMMFASMIPEMQARGAEVVIEIPKSFTRFAPLMRRSFPGVEVVVDTSQPTAVQSQILGGDLPRLFRPTFESFPKHTGYLKADPARVAWFKQYFREKFGTQKVVGFSWRGGDALARFKGLPLTGFSPLLSTPGVAFVDLQFGPHEAERETARKNNDPMPHRIPALDTWEDMDGVAACMMACDEIITVSNTNAHIAGALGQKVTNVIPSQTGAMWFWWSQREDSPWYPSMKIIRHKWGTPLDDLNRRLIADVTTEMGSAHAA